LAGQSVSSLCSPSGSSARYQYINIVLVWLTVDAPPSKYLLIDSLAATSDIDFALQLRHRSRAQRMSGYVRCGMCFHSFVTSMISPTNFDSSAATSDLVNVSLATSITGPKNERVRQLWQVFSFVTSMIGPTDFESLAATSALANVSIAISITGPSALRVRCWSALDSKTFVGNTSVTT
jgi:hypothetical protein